MKRYIGCLLTMFCILLTSCDKETEPSGTSVEKMAGDWWVTAHIMQDGQDMGDAGVGHFRMYTYNTAANLPTEMWLEDEGNFWDFRLRVAVDYPNRTFSTNGFVPNASYDCGVSITRGQILEGAATTPSGMPADSIVYFIQFDDDVNNLLYKISGFRRTGFDADDF